MKYVNESDLEIIIRIMKKIKKGLKGIKKLERLLSFDKNDFTISWANFTGQGLTSQISSIDK